MKQERGVLVLDAVTMRRPEVREAWNATSAKR
jgi:hypothetical protein